MGFDEPPIIPGRKPLDSERSNTVENEKKPEKLYRGFVVSPEDLSLEFLRKPLVVGTSAVGGDNEIGVYMSTNPRMVEQAYGAGNSLASMQCPKYDTGRGIRDYIELPGCGVIVEIETRDLEIRKPKIAPVWQGHYNNGFEGNEWIADNVPTDSFKIKKLTLARAPNDREGFSIELQNSTEEEINLAIEKIKAEYAKKKQEASRYRDFLESLPEATRLSGLRLKMKWEEYNK
jgi:hypothetical protein